MSSPADPAAFSKDRPFPAKLTENRLLNRPGSAKETRHFVVDLRYPSFLYEQRVLANMTVAVTAALDASGAQATQVTVSDIRERSARIDIRWA